MLARSILCAALILSSVDLAWAQTAPTGTGRRPQGTWMRTGGSVGGAQSSDRTTGAGPQSAASGGDRRLGEPAAAGQSIEAADAAPRRPIARVTTGDGTLPNQHGQLWREYDISPYTLRVTSTNRPEQAIVDWILRETGYEVWLSEPLAVLNADPRTLYVYHTPDMHQIVADIVDRFVSSEAETHAFGLRVATVSHPNWRARAQGLLQPVEVQTPGVQAWLLQKEDAALLLAELRRRPDYRQHSSPHLLVNNGQSTVVSATRGRSYVRSVAPRPDVWPGFQPESAMVDEGFSLEFSPLLSVDRQTIDAAIKCEINQVEKMVPVSVDLPTVAASRQRTKIEVPQIAQFHFHERFRWPVDQVLLVGMGVVALPVPVDGQTLVPGLPLPLPSGPPRADVLVFVESKGNMGQTRQAAQTGRPEAKTYRGRY